MASSLLAFSRANRPKPDTGYEPVMQRSLPLGEQWRYDFTEMKCCHAVPIVAFGLLLSLVIGALPISPGSLIVYESAMTYIFTNLGAPVHAALIITLLYRFLTFW